MVLHDQVVALELPVDVAVGLHLREGVAAERRRRAQTSDLSARACDAMAAIARWSRGSLPEHGDEQVDEQDVSDQQVNHQQDHHQPVAVLDPAWLLAGIDQRHVVRALHVPRLPNCKLRRGRHVWEVTSS